LIGLNLRSTKSVGNWLALFFVFSNGYAENFGRQLVPQTATDERVRAVRPKLQA
jgi:hypothetical protein